MILSYPYLKFKKFARYKHLPTIANVLLFLSSLLLLIDIAPKDFFPSYNKQVKAVSKLIKYENIIGYVPNGVNIKPESLGMSIVPDIDAYRTLKKIVEDNSNYSSSVHCSRAIGIGYSVVSIPVAKNKLDAFRPLYIVELPENQKDTSLILTPVGQLQDLNTWLSIQRQTSLTTAAIVLLFIGFFLQLVQSLFSESL